MIFGVILVALIIGFLSMIQTMQMDYASERVQDDEYTIPDEVISTAVYLLENPNSYDVVDLEIMLGTIPSIGAWDICFLLEGIINFSGIASIDGRNRIYIDDFSGTPTPDTTSSRIEEYTTPPSQRLCYGFDLSSGVHLIDLHLYETRKHYIWAIEIE